MRICYSNGSELSSDARALVDFDVDSIRRLIWARRGGEPDVWLVWETGYQKGPRVLRDSDAPRMIAYSRHEQVVYATDGCNACRHRLPAPLEDASETELQSIAGGTEISPDMLRRLVRILGGEGES